MTSILSKRYLTKYNAETVTIKRFKSLKVFPDDKWLVKNTYGYLKNWWAIKMDQLDTFCTHMAEIDHPNSTKKDAFGNDQINYQFVKYKFQKYVCFFRGGVKTITGSDGFKHTVRTISNTASSIGHSFAAYVEKKFSDQGSVPPQEMKTENATIKKE